MVLSSNEGQHVSIRTLANVTDSTKASRRPIATDTQNYLLQKHDGQIMVITMCSIWSK